MQINILSITLLIFTMISYGLCTTKDSKNIRPNEKTYRVDSININTNQKEKEFKKTEINIKGIWGHDENENAYFGIYDDSIYYPDPDLWYKYELNFDTLIIHKEDNNVEKIKIMQQTNDSLILYYTDFELTDTLLKR